jgi:hypothetical protein
MKNERETKKKSTNRQAPLSPAEVLLRDNVPASEALPADIAERFARNRVYLVSNDEDFDPKKCLTKVKGLKGTWELSTSKPVVSGLPVERTARVAPGSLKRTGKVSALECFRPPWQPHIYHPKAVAGEFQPRTLQRKSGAKGQPDTVFNRDDRQFFYPQGFPWHCVGRLIVSSANSVTKSGTGTLVGSRTVLTSSHMIPWGAPGLTIIFSPAFWNWPFPWLPGIPFIPPPLPGVTSFATDVWGYQQGKRVAYDLAVVRLQEPLGSALGFFGCRVYDDDWEDEPRWTLVGYPGLVGVTAGLFGGLVGYNNDGNMPTRQFGISVEDDDSDGRGLELEHRGDTTSGNSGGPLFGDWPDGPYVIGVHSTSFPGSDSLAAGGRTMHELVSWARATWP